MTKLPGVGRKTANVVLGHALGVPGLPVDRHVLRVANRIGLVKNDDPVKVEAQLCEMLPPERWTRASDALILHGRRICRPKPLCPRCNVRPDCDFYRTGVVTKPIKRKAARPQPFDAEAVLQAQKASCSRRAPRRRRRPMTREHFRELVEEAIDTIPLKFARQVRNLAIVIEDEPSDDLLDEMDIDDDGTLLGLYQGTPLNERGWGYGNQLPDRITLFQRPIEDDCDDDEDEIVVAIGETLIHELGHYFGMSEDEIMAIEERYWRGEPDPADVAEVGDDAPSRRSRRSESRASGSRSISSKPPGSTSSSRPSAATPDDSILEIGPGRGAITRPLAAQAGRLLAIEIDRDLAADLEAAALPNVTVVTGDVLSVDLVPIITDWLGAPPGPANQIRIVGNLPYNISSPILFALLDLAARTDGVRDAMLMLQKEVADRLVAKVGTGDYGVLTVLTALNADVTRVLSLPPGAFRPPPKVHSAVVRLAFRPPKVDVDDHDAVRPDGPDHVYAAPEDPRERAEAVRRRTRRESGPGPVGGRHRSRAASRDARPGRNGRACAGAFSAPVS